MHAAGVKAGLPLGPLVLELEPGSARLGDGIVAVITLTNGASQKQWLAQFEVDALTAEEKKVKSTYNLSIGPLSSGETWEISSKPAFALKIRALGPYVTLPHSPKNAAKSALDKTARALVAPELLSLGLDRAARALLPHGPALAAINSATLGKFSHEDEKAFAGSFVALLQFFMIAQETPGLKEIIWEIIDLPSVWSLARSLGKIKYGFDMGSVPVAELDPAGWKLPALPLYRYPFGLKLNDKPAVNCAFFATAPHPPLLTTAGIVGFTAHSPSHKDKHMLVQVIAAYRGKAM